MALNVRPLSAELQKLARDELNEDPARTEQDLAHIKEWLKKQPHIKARTDDQWLLTFLRGCKFSLERTKEKLDTYYTMRTVLPEYFSNRDPMLPELQDIFRLGVIVPLPIPDDHGRRVFLFRIGLFDPSKTKLSDVMKCYAMTSEILMSEDDELIIHGHVDMLDMQKITLQHAGQTSPAFAKKTVTCFQEGYPMRPKSINYINTSSIFHTAFSLFKVVMKEKFTKRLFIHGSDMGALYKQIPQRILPKEYGGDAGSIDDISAAWKKKVESYRDYFMQDEKNRTDEKKRPGRPKTQETMFGIEGSFRQLTLD